jgi:uncharacterized protein (TIGR03790 family)
MNRRDFMITCTGLPGCEQNARCRWTIKKLIIALAALNLPIPFSSSALAEDVPVVDGNSIQVATLIEPRSSIQPSEIAVIVNDNDPQSIAVANYYQQERRIPSQNMIHINFDQAKIYPGFTTNHGIDPIDFLAIQSQVYAATPANIQAYVVSWTVPYRLSYYNYYPTNYSVTSALAFGVNPNYIEVASCNAMPQNPYYNSNSTTPYSDFHVRPTMQLAGTSVANVKAMIDKAVTAGGTFPTGDGYFVRTADAARSVRWPDEQSTGQAWNRSDALTTFYLDYSTGGPWDLANTKNILFYETGSASLANLATDTFVPGSIGDSLTSFAGDLMGQLKASGQMSALRWLEAGAVASFGTETEPCNHTQKFPQASVLVRNYFQGNTLIEAYTKSVQWPAQGVFVGDPLTKPFGTKATLINGTLTIITTILTPGRTYTVSSAPSSSGPFTPIATVSVPNYQRATITVPNIKAPYYILVPDQG